jgi:hypothetical protein
MVTLDSTHLAAQSFVKQWFVKSFIIIGTRLHLKLVAKSSPLVATLVAIAKHTLVAKGEAPSQVIGPSSQAVLERLVILASLVNRKVLVVELVILKERFGIVEAPRFVFINSA